jgi:hypothetical protein
MFSKSDPRRLIFFANILAIVPLGCVVRCSHILPEYLDHISGDLVDKLLLIYIG